MTKKQGQLLVLSTLAGGVLGWGLAPVGLQIFQPLYWAGQTLRALSLSGHMGNIVSWAVVLFLCCLPLGCMALQKFRKRLTKEDCLLPAISVELFFLLYFLINPTLLPSPVPGFPMWLSWSMGCCALLASTVIAYGVMRLLRWLEMCEPIGLPLLFAHLLEWGSGLLAFSSCLSAVHTMRKTIAEIAGSNTATITSGLVSTNLLCLLLAGLELLPVLLGCWVMLVGAQLCRTLGDNPFGLEAVAAAHQTAHDCRVVVVACIALSITGNLIQLISVGAVHNLQFSIHLPLLPLLLSGGLLLLCQYIHGAKTLSDDNQSII